MAETTMLTRDETAQVLGVSKRWLEENKREGPPYYALNHKTIRYDRAEVLAWLKQRRVR